MAVANHNYEGLNLLCHAANCIETQAENRSARNNPHPYARPACEEEAGSPEGSRGRRDGGGRLMHNQHEKDRRAQQKNLFITLEQTVSIPEKSKKNSNVLVLKQATKVIQKEENRQKKLQHEMVELGKVRAALNDKLQNAMSFFETRHPSLNSRKVLELYRARSGTKELDRVHQPHKPPNRHNQSKGRLAAGSKAKRPARPPSSVKLEIKMEEEDDYSGDDARDGSETESASEDETSYRDMEEVRRIVPTVPVSEVVPVVTYAMIPALPIQVPVSARDSVIRTVSSNHMSVQLPGIMTSAPVTSEQEHTPLDSVVVRQQLHAKLKGTKPGVQASASSTVTFATTTMSAPPTTMSTVRAQLNGVPINGMVPMQFVHHNFANLYSLPGNQAITFLPLSVLPSAITSSPSTTSSSTIKQSVNGGNISLRTSGGLLGGSTHGLPAHGSIVLMQAPLGVPVSIPAPPQRSSASSASQDRL